MPAIDRIDALIEEILQIAHFIEDTARRILAGVLIGEVWGREREFVAIAETYGARKWLDPGDTKI